MFGDPKVLFVINSFFQSLLVFYKEISTCNGKTFFTPSLLRAVTLQIRTSSFSVPIALDTKGFNAEFSICTMFGKVINNVTF